VSSGAGDEVHLSSKADFPLDWSRDGRHLLVRHNAPGTRANIWVMPVMPVGAPRPVVSTVAEAIAGTVAPRRPLARVLIRRVGQIRSVRAPLPGRRGAVFELRSGPHRPGPRLHRNGAVHGMPSRSCERHRSFRARTAKCLQRSVTRTRCRVRKARRCLALPASDHPCRSRGQQPAFESLELAYREHSGWLSVLAVEPRFDRWNPRYPTSPRSPVH